MSAASPIPGGHREAPRRWFESPPGSYLIAAERSRIDRHLPGLFGYHIVQLGEIADGDLLSASRITHRVLVRLDADHRVPGCGTLVGAADSLPFTSDSVDVMVMPHVLEFAPDPHRVLREVERALIADGHLVLTGFNPWSLWGLVRVALAWRDEGPWSGHYYGLARIRDWLSLLNFDIVVLDRFFYRPPLSGSRVMTRLLVLEKLGRYVWPLFSGAYLIVAKKRVVPLTPLRMRWHARRNMVNTGIAEPSVRSRVTE